MHMPLHQITRRERIRNIHATGYVHEGLQCGRTEGKASSHHPESGTAEEAEEPFGAPFRNGEARYGRGISIDTGITKCGWRICAGIHGFQHEAGADFAGRRKVDTGSRGGMTEQSYCFFFSTASLPLQGAGGGAGATPDSGF